MPWMIVLAAYFAVGFTLIFVGPAARARRREQTIWEWEWHPARRPWMQKIILLSIALGTLAYWPVFTPWGKRELHGWIAAVQIWHPRSLPYETYLQIRMELPWFHQENFRRRLSELGWVITGFAKGPNGEDVPVAARALSVGTPFALTQVLSEDISSWLGVDREWLGIRGLSSSPPAAHEWLADSDDEVWAFSSDAASWMRLGGRAGVARVRKNVVTDICTTAMN